MKICCHGNSLRLNFFSCASVGCGIKRKAGDCKDERAAEGGENFNEMRVFRGGREESVRGLRTATPSCHIVHGGTTNYHSSFLPPCFLRDMDGLIWLMKWGNDWLPNPVMRGELWAELRLYRCRQLLGFQEARSSATDSRCAREECAVYVLQCTVSL